MTSQVTSTSIRPISSSRLRALAAGNRARICRSVLDLPGHVSKFWAWRDVRVLRASLTDSGRLDRDSVGAMPRFFGTRFLGRSSGGLFRTHVYVLASDFTGS